MVNNFHKIKNVLDFDIASDIKEIAYSDRFPWFFIESSTGLDTSNIDYDMTHYSFFHVLYSDKKIMSNFIELANPLLDFMKDSMEVKEILRIRIGMQTKISEKTEIINLPHTDYTYDNKVLLYYVDDSDGDTVLYDKYYENSQSHLNLNEEIRNKPEFNSALNFDGLRYHSSSHPFQSDRRIAININYIGGMYENNNNL